MRKKSFSCFYTQILRRANLHFIRIYFIGNLYTNTLFQLIKRSVSYFILFYRVYQPTSVYNIVVDKVCQNYTNDFISISVVLS